MHTDRARSQNVWKQMSTWILKIETPGKVSQFSSAKFLCRGGIAVVWLGKRDDQLFAMK